MINIKIGLIGYGDGGEIVKKNNYLSYSFFIRNGYEIYSEDIKCWTLVKC
jgi:hypothetical protein